MDRNNDKITSNQLFSVLTGTILGIGILSMPASLAKLAGPDSLIVLTVGSLTFLLITLLIVKLVERYPGKTIIEMGSDLTGKFLGKIIGFYYFLYLIGFTAIEARSLGSLAKNFMLFNTPIEVIIATFLFTSVYTVRSGIETLARFAVIVLPVATIPVFLTIALAIPDVDPGYFLPILRTPFMELLKALFSMIFSYLGLEFILFLGIFVDDKENIRRISLWSIIFVFILSFFTVFVTIGVFGIEETETLIWPVVTIFKTIDLPGTILENVEVVIMSTWTLSIYLTLCSTFYGASFILGRIFGLKEFNFLVLPLVPIVYLLALIPENVAELYEILDVFATYGGGVAIGTPIVLLALSYLKKQKKGMKKSG